MRQRHEQTIRMIALLRNLPSIRDEGELVMMPTGENAFTIQCINSKKEIINLRIKNTPDIDEMANIIQIGKKIQRMYCILLGLVIVLVFSFIVSCMWFLRPPAKSDLTCVYMIVLSLIYVVYCISSKAIGLALEKRIVMKKGCDYVWRYMETYDKERWNELLSYTKGYRTLLDIGFSKSTDEADMVISFGRTFFMLCLTDCVCEIFWLKNIIRNPTLNKNRVEFDFLKNELKVPLGFKLREE